MLYRLRRIEEACSPPTPSKRAAARRGRVRDQGLDSFAADFDEVLHRLEYRAPALVGMDLQRIDGEPRVSLDVMDAGCGTGLLAQHLRPYARRLVGVTFR